MANTYTYNQILRAGTQASYSALGTYDPNVLYFCTDSGKIYKGNVDFTNNVIVADSKPETPIAGKLYVLTNTNTVEVYVSGAWKLISNNNIVTTIDFDDVSDDQIPTTKAVFDFVTTYQVNQITGIGPDHKDYHEDDPDYNADGKLYVDTNNDDLPFYTVTVPGVVTTPTWDAAARKLTLPISDGEAVEVNIGKDIFIDTTADNKYNPDTGNLEIYLNDGSEGSESTMISIPASGLVDVYTGENTSSANTTVTDTNVIKVDINVDPVEGNALVLTSSGLKVDLSAYAKTNNVNEQISALTTAVEEAQSDADTANTAIGVLNDDATNPNSVSGKIATALSNLDLDNTSLGQRVTDVETANATNSEKINALATATTSWGTF